MGDWTPEPWSIHKIPGRIAIGKETEFGGFGWGGEICSAVSSPTFNDEKMANLERIVSCVNALSGVPNPEGVGEAIAGLELIMDIGARQQTNGQRVDTCIDIAERALRAMGLEVGE